MRARAEPDPATPATATAAIAARASMSRNYSSVVLKATNASVMRGSRCATVSHRRHAADDGAARRDARVGARDGRSGHGHDLARRGVPVVAQARNGGAFVDGNVGVDRTRDGAADDWLGNHLAVHASSRAGG